MRRIVLTLTLAALACQKKTPDPTRVVVDAAVAPVVSASSSATPVTPRGNGVACASPAGEIDLDRAALIRNLTDVEDVQVAVTRSSSTAIVTFAIDGDLGCEHDGCYTYHEGYAFEVDAAGKPSTAGAPPSSAAGIGPTTSVAPFALGSELFILSQGHGGAAAMPEPGKDVADTIYVVQNTKTTIQKADKTFSGMFAATHGGFAIGTGTEWGRYRRGFEGPPSVRVFRLFKNKAPESELVVKQPGAAAGEEEKMLWDDSYDAPAIASDVFANHDVDAGLASRVAIAFRHRQKNAPSELFALWVDAKTGKPIGRPALVAKGDVGAPTLVILENGALEIVFARRASSTTPYVLERATWTSSSDPKPSTPTTLTIATSSPSSSVLAPALARMGSTVGMAWMESKAGGDRNGSVFAGFGSTLAEAASAPKRQSSADVKNARDPEWGYALDHALLAWTEHDGPRRIRFSWCR